MSRSVYVGTKSTWKKHFDAALAKAIELREATMAVYNSLINQANENAETIAA